MGFVNNLKVVCLYCLASRQGRSHAARMEKLYGRRSAEFDAVHHRTMPGRKELFENLPTPVGGVWIDLGAGTGFNLEHLGERLAQLAKVYLVEASPSMREIARQRVERHGWKNVEIVDADALSFVPALASADVVTLAYSLAMIQPWFAALEHAHKLLRPGGCVGVVEYYVSAKHAPTGFVQHNWLTRHLSIALHHFWEVHPDQNHVPYLHAHFGVQHFTEASIRTLMPGLQFPYFVFIGKKD
jgi:S-adenosylmethionine-diacylgycerolhomoserine-N-methlytransferase